MLFAACPVALRERKERVEGRENGSSLWGSRGYWNLKGSRVRPRSRYGNMTAEESPAKSCPSGWLLPDSGT